MSESLPLHLQRSQLTLLSVLAGLGHDLQGPTRVAGVTAVQSRAVVELTHAVTGSRMRTVTVPLTDLVALARLASSDMGLVKAYEEAFQEGRRVGDREGFNRAATEAGKAVLVAGSAGAPRPGKVFSAADVREMGDQLAEVFDLMRSGQAYELAKLAEHVSGRLGRDVSEAGVSARIRDLRKPCFGGHTVERKKVGPRTYSYRLVLTGQQQGRA